MMELKSAAKPLYFIHFVKRTPMIAIWKAGQYILFALCNWKNGDNN